MHKMWLGDIYDWAGSYRQVNLSKGDFPSASALQLSRLMTEFEKGMLEKYTPSKFASQRQLVEAIAETHVEFVLIHPFREGNGRLARFLATLMGLQAGLPLLILALSGAREESNILRLCRQDWIMTMARCGICLER